MIYFLLGKGKPFLKKEGEPVRRVVSLLLGIWLLFMAFACAESREVIKYLDPDMEKPALYNGSLPEDLVYAPLEAHFINIGSADSILLRAGDWTMLVDSGIESNAQRIIDYLEAVGVDHLDYAFGTHPHDDHIGGFPEIFKAVSVGTYLQPTLFDDVSDSRTRKLAAALANRRIPIQSVADGDVLTFGSLTLRFFQWQKQDARINNRSMILKVECGVRSLLLAADLEEHSQNALAKQYGERLQADILKFPHHGLTGYTPSFHKAVSPALCVISNTEARIEKTVRALDRRGCPWLLTTQGTVVAVTDGGQWQVWQLPKKATDLGEEAPAAEE